MICNRKSPLAGFLVQLYSYKTSMIIADVYIKSNIFIKSVCYTGRYIMSKKAVKLVKMQGTLINDQGTNVFRPLRKDKIEFAMYIIENKDQTFLLQKIGKHYADLYVYQILKTQLSVITGVADVKQITIAALAGIDTAKISASVKRLQAADLVRKLERFDGVPSGFVLNPDVVVVGDHKRARLLWEKAREQARSNKHASANALADTLIDNINTLVCDIDDDDERQAIIEKTIAQSDNNAVKKLATEYFNERFRYYD
jgi:hypothetical protein